MKTSSDNKSRLRNVLVGALLTAGVFFGAFVYAAEETAQTRIPATSAAIWQAIDQETAALAKIIAAGELEDVHHRAFAIRDLVAALPAVSGSLPAAQLAKVKANATFVATLAERLDASGDANDKAVTESHFKKLQDILKSTRANYLQPASN